MTVALLWLLGGVLGLMMLVQGLSRRVDLFSIRNVYLAGFIVYQIVSPASALQSGNFAGFRIADPDRAGRWMLLFVYLYIGVYLLSYHRIAVARWIAGKFSGGGGAASDSLLTGLAISLIVTALAVKTVGSLVPIVRPISINVAVALAATACAITGWIWGGRRMNPAVLLIVVLVLSVSAVIALSGFYSRRPLVSILAGFAWGAYHRWARQLAPGRLLISTAPLVVAAALVVAAFTAIRTHSTGMTEAQATLQQMTQADLNAGTGNLLSGQASGSAALWILENFPRMVDYDHLFSLRYMAYWYVPRMLWDSKPDTLANNIARLARIRAVNWDVITLPPGVIGYAAAEGGLYALVIYALFFGQFTRFFDELVRRNPVNPFIILPIGCATGQFLGLARGDIAIFANLALVGFVSAFLIIYLTSLAFGRSHAGSLAAPWPQMR